ncbi:MAG: type II secretion system F family protein [Gammaproteobacteria bacterium]|nr:type II secretion system F family protein [Gammaproteobacteria bacterium]
MADKIQTFLWTGIDKKGKRVGGKNRAPELKDAQAELAKQGITIISIQQKKDFNISIGGPPKIKSKSILLFTRYLSTMLFAGLPILQALDIIAQDQDNVAMQSFVVELRNNIASGKTLAESFAEHPEIFGDLYCSLIKAGEKSGTLDKILKRLANYLERSESLRGKIKKALVYPAAIITISLLVSSIMLIFVVPKFQEMFKSFGAELPLFTRMVVHLSNFMTHYWWLLLIIIVGGIWGLKVAIRKSAKFRYALDSMSLRIYIIGPILKKGIIARYTRTLSTTLESGMPINEAMDSMKNVMGNIIYANAVETIRQDVVSGHQFSTSMAATNLFPNMVVQMISVGEASGSLAEMLNKVADYYEEEVNNIVDGLSSLLEPLIMVLLGVIIGGLVIAMYLPIFKMGSLF